MKRLSRPLLLTSASGAAIVAFVAAGRWAPAPIDVTDLSGWLRATDPVDALAELARIAGLLLAMYVALVSAAALVAEVAAILRMPRLTRAMRRLVHLFAVPALRKRLLEVAAVTAVTASSLHAVPAGAATAPRPPAVVMSPDSMSRSDAPAVLLGGEFVGFDLPAPVAPPESTTAGVYTVQPGDTLWNIVDQHYGRVDLELLSKVLEANPGIRDPNVILVGWTLVLPQLERGVPAEVEVPPPFEAPPVPPAESSWAVVVVVRGDTLWDIVDRHYGGATAELVWATVSANPDIDHPDLIFAGQQITLPPRLGTSPAPAVEPTPIAPPEEARVAETPTAPTVSDRLSSPPIVTTTTPSPAPTQAVAPTSIPLATPAPPSDASVSATADRSVAAEADEDTTPAVATIVGWTGAAGLAAGLLALASRRRRRQPTAVRHARQAKSSVVVGVALHETEHVAGVDRAALALRLIGTKISSRRGEPTPVPRLLRVTDEQLELVWDSPNPVVIQPWESPDGGWSWTLAPDVELEPTDAPSPCPTLVTVGRHNGSDVLLNLETCGVLSITGDPTKVVDVARSIASELATSMFAESPTVLVVGELSLVGNPEHARAVEPDEAASWLRDRSESASALLAHRRLTSLFALRSRSKPLDAHEPVVIVIDAAHVGADQLTEITDRAQGDLGAVVILVGSRAASEWCLVVEPNGIRLEPLGLQLEPAAIDEAFVSAAAEFIPPADPELDESIDDVWEDDPEVDGDLVLADHLDIVHLHNRALPLGAVSAPDGEPDEGGADDWDVELKVLGQVRAIGTKEPLSPTELHLAIYLAFNRSGENADTIATMLWPNGIKARTVTNAMASLRRKLGTGVNGEPLFPLGRDNQYTYHLSERVVTDWDRFVALVDRAGRCDEENEEADLLDEALELIDGPPFRASTGYSWAYSDGTATLISDTVRAAAARAIRLHDSQGDQLKTAHARHCAQALLDEEITSSAQPSAPLATPAHP